MRPYKASLGSVAVAVAVTDTFRILDIYICIYIFSDTYYFVSCFSVIVADVLHV